MLEQIKDKSLSSKGPIKLGAVHFSSHLLLAPLSGVTDIPYRLLMQQLGSGGSISELVSAEGIIRDHAKTVKLLTIDKQEKNVGIQIFGHDPNSIAKAAAYVEEKISPDFIDINAGCPVKKVVAKGSGSALLKDLPHLKKIVSQTKQAISTPLSVKIRTGWDHESINVRESVENA